jgi:hypothetical protein
VDTEEIENDVEVDVDVECRGERRGGWAAGRACVGGVEASGGGLEGAVYALWLVRAGGRGDESIPVRSSS